MDMNQYNRLDSANIVQDELMMCTRKLILRHTIPLSTQKTTITSYSKPSSRRLSRALTPSRRIFFLPRMIEYIKHSMSIASKISALVLSFKLTNKQSTKATCERWPIREIQDTGPLESPAVRTLRLSNLLSQLQEQNARSGQTL